MNAIVAPAPLRAAIYARFSTDRQTESSIVDQLRVCNERAAREGWRVVANFEDQGISGAALGNRPGVKSLMAAAIAREFDVLLVMDLTRLSRNQGDLPKMIERMKARGVDTIGVHDGFDTRRRGYKMQAGVSGVFGEMFREQIADKTHAGLETRATRGQATGGTAYGYTTTRPHGPEAPAELAIVESEAAVVRELFDRYAEGDSQLAIVSDLNARGIASPRGASWRISAVHAMLQSELYVGRLVWNRSKWVKDPDSGKRLRIERPESEWVRTERPELAIVPAATWERAQRRIGRRAQLEKSGRGGRVSRHMLSGLLRCGECGGAFIVSAAKPLRYSCATYKSGGAAACSNAVYLRASVAEQKILDQVSADMCSPEAVALAVATVNSLAAADAPTEPADLSSWDREIAELERLRGSGLLSETVVAAGLAKARAERAAAAKPRAIGGGVNVSGAEAEYRSVARNFRAAVAGENVPAIREALRELLAPLPLKREGGKLVAQLAGGPMVLAQALAGLIWRPSVSAGIGSGGRI